MRRARKQARRALFYKQPLGHPARLWRHWTYSSTKTIAPSWAPIVPAQPAITTGIRFRANTIYDPDFVTGGQECIGQSDTLANYDHYVVYYTRFTAEFWPWVTSTATGTQAFTNQSMIPVWFGLSLRDDPTVLDGNTVRLMNTDRLTTYHMTSMGSEIPKGGKFRLTQWFNARSFFNCDPRDKENLVANPGANPTEMAYFLIHSAPMNAPGAGGTNDYGAWNVTIHMDLWGFCMEPRGRGAIP